MPDLSTAQYVPVPEAQQFSAPITGAKETVMPPNPAAMYQNMLSSVAKQIPNSAKNAQLNNPFLTRLDQTLRYTDPDIGYSPLDASLEYKYADAHPIATFRNNVIQGGARFVGAAAEVIGTIPIALTSIGSDKSLLETLHNNPYSNGITDWLDGLENSLPTYTSQYEAEHPFLKYITPWNLNAFAGAWGSAINNFGYTAGAIAGALIEDVAITALTGGTGLFPALAANGVQLTKMLGRIGKATVAAPKEIMALVRSTMRSADNVGSTALMRNGSVALRTGTESAPGVFSTGENITSQALRNADEVVDAAKVKDIDKTITNAYNYYKIRDAVKYNLALLTSASAEAAFEAAHVRKNGLDELKNDYYNLYGHDASAEEVKNLEFLANDVANNTMLANVGLLYLSNRINWGSLFKPTNAAIKQTISGFGKNIARQTLTRNIDDAGNIAYKVVSKTPESTIGKILLNGEKLGKIGFRSFNEGVEEGSQFIISESNLDYARAKFDAQQRGEVADYLNSFYKGVSKTFETNEGWDNIIGGFVGGIMGGGIMRKIQNQDSEKKRMQQMADLMNQHRFNGTFENKIQEASVQSYLGQKHKEAVEKEDVFQAKNIKTQMLYNWVSSGIRANSYERRMEELDMVRDLEGESFKSYWGVSDTAQNRAEVNKFLDGVKQKSEIIKRNVERIDYLTKNPYNPKTQQDDFKAYESYKDELARNLYESHDYRTRIQEVSEKLKTLSPGLDLQKAVNLTSIEGLRVVLRDIQTTIDKLGLEMQELQNNEELLNPLAKKHDALSKLFRELQPLVTDTTTSEENWVKDSAFHGRKYVAVLQKLYNLMNGIDLENNQYIEDQLRITDGNTIFIEPSADEVVDDADKLGDALQELQDIYKLTAANLNVQRYYNFLRQGVGAIDFMDKVKKMIDENNQFQQQTNFKTPEEEENEIEEEVRFNNIPPDNVEETTSEEREIIRRAAKKTVVGEELSTEEAKVAEEKPVAFTNEVKIQQKVKKEVDERINNGSKSPLQTEAKADPATQASEKRTTKDISAKTLFGLFSQDKNEDFKSRTNLYAAIFQSGVNNVFQNLTVNFTTPEPQNIVFTNIEGTKLYRKSFEENINIYHNGNIIGILRPQNSLFLDPQGNRSIYDLTEAEYFEVTGNTTLTYAEFMAGIRAYQDAYNKLKAEINQENSPIFDINTINKYFNLSINPGARTTGKDAKKDVLLSNAEYKPEGTALVSYNEVINFQDGTSSKTEEPVILNRAELTDEQIAQVEALLEKNKATIRKNINRYAVVYPIQGQYVSMGIVYARNAETNTVDRELYYGIIKKVASGELTEDEINEQIQYFDENYFIANADRTTKNVYINTIFNTGGDLVIQIFNKQNKVNKTLTIDRAAVQNTKDYGELMNLINNKLVAEESLDRNLARLGIVINEDSLKRQIPNREVNTLAEVADRIKLSTPNPKIFENFNINFNPNQAGSATGTTTPAPNQPNTPSVDEIATQVENIVNRGENPKNTKPVSKDDKYNKVDFNDLFNNISKVMTGQTKSTVEEANKLLKQYLKEVHPDKFQDLNQKRIANIFATAMIEVGQKGDIDKLNELYNLFKSVMSVTVAPQQTVTPTAPINDARTSIISEYQLKRRELTNERNNNLSPSENAIKTALANDPQLAYSIPNLMAAANVTEEDVNTYIRNLNNFNEQFNILKAIQQQRIANLTNAASPIFAKTKAGVITIMKDLFGLSDEQANATADIYQMNAEAWATRNNQPIENYFKQLGFASQLNNPNAPNVLNQIIGEKGVANLEDANNILNNLGLAKLMQSRGIYSRSQIRQATGWELTGDNKWKYEVADNFTLNAKMVERLREADQVVTLGNLIGRDSNVLKAYPQLAKIKVTGSGTDTSSYNSATGYISISISRLESLESLKGVLVHEMQHAIQDIEGFPQGGSPDIVSYILFEKYKQKEKFNNYEIVEQNGQFFINDDLGWSEGAPYGTRDLAETALDKMKNDLSYLASVYQDMIDKNVDEYEAYRRIAGEVEARNVETRLNYTDQQRLERTLNSTEDIEEESKIYLQDKVAQANDYTDIGKVIQGFKLVPKYQGSLFVGFTTVNQAANKNLATRINDWAKQNNIPVSVSYSPTYATINLRSNQGVLFQAEAWHGSPHTFDRFTTNKIGTGEGVQAFGWGLYFTDLKSIARNYAKTLAENQESVTINGEKVNYTYDYNDIFNENTKEGRILLLNPINNYNYLQKIKGEWFLSRISTNNEGDEVVVKTIKADSVQNNPVNRNLYKVTLHKGKTPDQYTWLEWDKPVSKFIINKLLENNTLKKAIAEHKRILSDDYESKLKNNNYTGEQLYDNILPFILDILQPMTKYALKTKPKDVSLFLLEAGIDGIKYPAESLARGTTSDTARGFNYVVFDENSVTINERLQFQNAQGAYDTLTNTIYALTNPNVSTPLHELAHSWESQLTALERQKVLEWTGQLLNKDSNIDIRTSFRDDGSSDYTVVDNNGKKIIQEVFYSFKDAENALNEYNKNQAWNRETSEAFARGFETYLAEGNKTNNKELNSLFDKFAKWLADIYQNIKEALGLELNDNMRQIYANMLNSEVVAKTTKAKVQKVIAPVVPVTPAEQDLTKPITDTTNYAEVSAIQKGVQSGFYEEQLRNGTMTEEQVREVLRSAGLAETSVEGMLFKVNNPDLLTALANGIPQGINVSYLRSGINEAIKDGRFEQAVREGIITVEKAQEILNYFGVNQAKFQPLFDSMTQQTGDILTPAALTEDEQVAANLLKANPPTGNDVYSGIIRDMLDQEDYQGIFQMVKDYLSDDLNTMSTIFNPATQAAVLKAVGIEQEYNGAEDFINNRGGLDIEPEEEATTPQDKYVQYPELGQIRYGKVIAEDGLITTIEDENGNQVDKLTSKLIPATEQEYKEVRTVLDVPNAQYRKGDKVVYGDNNETFTITGAELRARPITKKVTLKDQNGNIRYDNKGNILTATETTDSNQKDVFYTTLEGMLISEAGITGRARKTEVEQITEIKREHKKREVILRRIGDRFQQLFPQIKYELGYYEFNAPARFYKGKVQINIGYNDRKYTKEEINTFNGQDPFNVPWLKRETIAHEFMHPFILALKTSNRQLYNNLVEDLNKNYQDVTAEVDRLIQSGTYTEENRNDEGLAIFLGRELTKAFNKDGTVNIDYVKASKQSLVEKFVQWLKDMIDYLTGKRKTVSLDDFVIRANTNANLQGQKIRDSIKKVESLKTIYIKKHRSDLKKFTAWFNKEYTSLGYVDFVNMYIGESKEADIENLINQLQDYISQTGNGRFVFSIRDNQDSFVEFDKTDPDQIQVYIDSKFKTNFSNPSLLVAYSGKLNDNDIADEFIDVVNNNFYQKGNNETKTSIGVNDLNPLMNLQDINNLFVSQFAEDTDDFKLDEKIAPFKLLYTGEELTAIDELEAYMELEADQAQKIRKRILAKLPQLKDTAERRLNSEVLKLNYNIIRNLNLDANDIDFVLQYIEQASISINSAWRSYNQMVQDIKAKQGNLTKAELNRFNKELGVIRQLISFYDEFSKYTQFKEDFSDEQHIKFSKSLASIELLKQSMQDTAINLTIEWFTPYMNQHNKYIKQSGVTDEEYQLTPKKLYDFFKYGTGRDTNFITYWLGSNITSRDPINALFANTVSDMLTANNFDIVSKSFDINEEFNKFLKDKGIGINSTAAQIKYYKENYLRKAVVKSYKYDEDNKAEEVYIEKWALHQQYFFDKYEKDLENERKKYANPRSSEEAIENNKKLEAWKESVNYGKSAKYYNKEYDKLKSDKFFKLIEKNYLEANENYGENQLKYGIIPQKYDVNYLEQAKRTIASVKASEGAKGKFNEVRGIVEDTLGGTDRNNIEYNLDGTIYRTISTNLTRLKEDENVSLDLHTSIIDFVTEGTNYGSLRETQYQAETLSMLIEGNAKFSIPERKFSQEDFNAKIRDKQALRRAKLKLSQLQNAKDNNEPYDKDLYDKLTKKVAKGVESKNLWDSFAPRLKPRATTYNNDMLIQQINDLYFGESTEEVRIGNVNATKLAHYLSLYTSINSMAGNTTAALSNVNIGNVQLFIEGHGGQYFNKKDVVKASLDYVKNIPNFIKDLQHPIKSKDTQLSFMLDAIQGEVQDEFGERISGNIARKMFRTNSLFLLTSLGEHQIQITGMKAMMLGRKVKTKSGETISLYDAYVADANGRYNLRKDLVDFTQEDLAKFTRDLHGVNRSLNGNYSEFNKTVLQRKWYGTLMLKFRKYLYPAFRTRYASKHIDYERNIVEIGYMRFLFGTYIKDGVKGLLNRRNGFRSMKDLQPYERIALRKSIAELGLYAGITILTMASFGGDEDEKKELSDFQKYLLFLALRLRSDLGMYHIDIASEATRQLKNPTASLNTVVAFGQFVTQLWNPGEVYDKKTGNHEAGDSKLAAKFGKLIPFYSRYIQDIDNKLGYFDLINRNIEGVSPKQSTP